jgi:hypothetical protein
MHEHRIRITKESQPLTWLICLRASSRAFANRANKSQGSQYNAVRLAASPIILLLCKLILLQPILARIRGTERERRIAVPEVAA